MKRNTTIAIFLILLLTPVFALAQTAEDSGLVLDGKAERCSSAEVEDSTLECRKLRMVFRNQGKEPVIIINPTLGYGTGLKEARFYFEYSDFDFKTYRFFGNKGESVVTFDSDTSKAENFRSMAHLFAGDRPSENMSIVLQPGESYLFNDKFESKPQYKTTAGGTIYFLRDGKSVKDVIESQKESAKYFKLTYEFSFISFTEDPDLLDRMSQRWRRYGRLPVGPNGTYTITSEKIK